MLKKSYRIFLIVLMTSKYIVWNIIELTNMQFQNYKYEGSWFRNWKRKNQNFKSFFAIGTRSINNNKKYGRRNLKGQKDEKINFNGGIYTLRGYSDFELRYINTIVFYYHYFRILLIAIASCYLPISLIGQKIFSDFLCNLLWFSKTCK